MKLIEKLKATNSKVEKCALLSNITDLEKEVFKHALNPLIVHGFKFHEFSEDNLGEPTEELFDVLNSRQGGRNVVKNDIEMYAKEHGDLIKLIVNKDLRCGVGATLVNSVYKDLVPQFKVQLAKSVPVVDLSFPMIAQLKYDGVRLIAINDNGNTTFFTRNGKVVKLPSLKDILDSNNHFNYMLDGELTLIEGKQEDRTTVSGMVNSAMHGGLVDQSILRLHAFDFMKLDDWRNRTCDLAYAERYSVMSSLLSSVRSEHFVPAHSVTLANAEDALDYYQEVIDEGYEGLILKSAEHKYSFKRSKDWVKIKEVKSADLMCVGWQGGTGKYSGLIGALLCEGEVEGEQVKVKVAGLSMMAACIDPEINYVGKTIEIKYNSVTKDKRTGVYSLFLPRFSCVRIDK